MSYIVKIGDARGSLYSGRSRSVSSRQILTREDRVTCGSLHSPAPAMLDSTVPVESLNSKNAPALVSKLETNPHRHSLAA
jgi:hypothetical protein